jgi:hypothetical protein
VLGLGPLKPIRWLLLIWARPKPTIQAPFSIIQNCPDSKNRKTNLPNIQNLPNFSRLKIISKVTTFLLGINSNSQHAGVFCTSKI